MFAGSMEQARTWVIASLIAAGLGGAARPVRAQDQFVLVDETYTATAANTEDSHYRVKPRAGTPTNWRAPVDFAAGRVYARLDVKTKPSSKLTLYNICFEATPSYACMPYGRYTSTGLVEFDYPFSAFYQYDMVDWSQGVKQIALILKDESEKKMQGSPDFYPTTIHVTLTVVRAGAKYVPPAATVDAGTPEDAGMPDAGEPEPSTDPPPMAGAGGRPAPMTDAGVAMPKPPATPPQAGASGAAGTSGVAGMSASATAGSQAPATMMPPGGPQTQPPAPATGSGQPRTGNSVDGAGACALSAARAGGSQGWWVLIMCTWLGLAARARRRRSTDR